MFKIQTLNSISPVIHEALSAGLYTVSSNEPTPDAILVRSAAMHDMTFPESLLAIARAGAGCFGGCPAWWPRCPRSCASGARRGCCGKRENRKNMNNEEIIYELPSYSRFFTLRSGGKWCIMGEREEGALCRIA